MRPWPLPSNASPPPPKAFPSQLPPPPKAFPSRLPPPPKAFPSRLPTIFENSISPGARKRKGSARGGAANDDRLPRITPDPRIPKCTQTLGDRRGRLVAKAFCWLLGGGGRFAAAVARVSRLRALAHGCCRRSKQKNTLKALSRARSETESKCSETERACDKAYWVALFCAPSRRPDHDLQTQTELEIILCHMFV